MKFFSGVYFNGFLLWVFSWKTKNFAWCTKKTDVYIYPMQNLKIYVFWGKCEHTVCHINKAQVVLNEAIVNKVLFCLFFLRFLRLPVCFNYVYNCPMQKK